MRQFGNFKMLYKSGLFPKLAHFQIFKLIIPPTNSPACFPMPAHEDFLL